MPLEDGSFEKDLAEVQYCVLLAHMISQNSNPHMTYKSDAVISLCCHLVPALLGMSAGH